jgi:RNA polymerase-associated protein
MMNLYSGTTCPFSHRCRIVLFEKGMDFQVIDVDMFNKPEEMAAINPHNRVPVLVERDLVCLNQILSTSTSTSVSLTRN